MAIVVNNNLLDQMATDLLTNQTSGTFQGGLVSNTIMLLTTGFPAGAENNFTDLTAYSMTQAGMSAVAVTWSGPYNYFDGSWGAVATSNFVPTGSVSEVQVVGGYAILGLPGGTQVEMLEEFDTPAYIVNLSSFLNVGLNIQISQDGIVGAAEIEN